MLSFFHAKTINPTSLIKAEEAGYGTERKKNGTIRDRRNSRRDPGSRNNRINRRDSTEARDSAECSRSRKFRQISRSR